MRRILGIATGSVLTLSLVAVTAASAATTVVVRPSSMGSWAAQTRDPNGIIVPMNDPYCHGSVAFVNGPASPPLGVGSAELRTGDGTTGGDCSTELRNSAYSGVKLSSLTALSYWTYVTTNNGQQFPYIELNIDSSGTGTAPDDALFFEPPYQAPGAGGSDCAHQSSTVMLTWQSWDALSGCWWSNNGTLNPGTSTGTLGDYLAQFPNARIVNSASGGGVHVLMGFASPTDVFDGNVDAFTIGSHSSTTYDFEPNLPPPTTKDQCKGKGWTNYADASGRPFKNQGDCVSYVATHAGNPAGG